MNHACTQSSSQHGRFTFEVVTDPTETAKAGAQLDRAKKNGDWLQHHWSELLPQARGRYVAVAGQEAHIADTAEAAWAWAARVHPEDDGALVQYVLVNEGPRMNSLLRSSRIGEPQRRAAHPVFTAKR
jgi:hypothetical protein